MQAHIAPDSEQATTRFQKQYTVAIFMAADNNLARYALYNIEQMLKVGSNHNVNIVVQINEPGNLNATQRYLIEKGKKTLITCAGGSSMQKLNIGHPQTLVDFVDWLMKHYPANNLILNLWSHGSGIYDPMKFKNFENINDPTDDENLEELMQRAICFDDTYKSYMTNQDIKFALNEIQHKVLRGKKIAILWLEACLMSMIEVTNIFKDHVEYLVSSENVEYAPGSSYSLVLAPLTQNPIPNPHEFACHIVHAFQQVYGPTTLGFTQSAINLSKTMCIEANINLVAQQLIIAMQNQKNKSVTTMLKKCKSRPLCTCFHEPSFIDLRHFYINLQANIGQISLTDGAKEGMIKASLLKLLDQGVYLINSAVIANATGHNLKNAGGISIYFPENGIFNSYPKSNFAQSNNWSTMLTQYMILSK